MSEVVANRTNVSVRQGLVNRWRQTVSDATETSDSFHPMYADPQTQPITVPKTAAEPDANSEMGYP
jgi:hypothetical protein